MHVFSAICNLILAAYIAFEALRSPAKYRQFKQAVDAGTPGARKSFYYEILWFEGITAALAVAALRFAGNSFDPARLDLASSSFGSWWLSLLSHVSRDFIYGASAGILIVVPLLFIVMKMARRKATNATPAPQPQEPSRFLPDFTYLLPHFAGERWLFAAVAVSAGICEEVVFRAWLLTTLHGPLHLNGWILVLAGAAVFGVLHVYQGFLGFITTMALALVLSGLYVGTGTLLVPIVIHVLVDLRWAAVPQAPGPAAQTVGQDAD